MVQSTDPRLDAAFGALSDATRRRILQELEKSDASISDLAARFRMTPTGMKKHVSVLERAGLVRTEKVGRVRTCRPAPNGLIEASAWIEHRRRLWNARFHALDRIVGELKSKEKENGTSGQ